MPPKRVKKAAPRPLPANDEESKALDPTNPVLYIEHCQQFQLQLQLNAHGAPRRGAFELSFAPNPTAVASEQRPLWSGLKRTPRAQKFPDVDDIYQQIVEILNELSGKGNKRKRTSQSPSTSTSASPSPSATSPASSSKRSEPAADTEHQAPTSSKRSKSSKAKAS
ncbi:GH12971 [Drosophila grimshawi]|uniref:GH12971 n=1 Tax=Drosophila grimshawi TaxID=7222 RepID=B4K395_DROGR|nr:GH12971 [Drosophila grimshawi]